MEALMINNLDLDLIWISQSLLLGSELTICTCNVVKNY